MDPSSGPGRRRRPRCSHRRWSPVGILVAEGIAALETDGQPLGEVVRKIQTGRDAAESAAVDDALRIVAAERREVARLLTAAADRKVIVLIEGRAGNLVDPVGPSPVLRRVEARRTLRIARGEIVPVVEVADELLARPSGRGRGRVSRRRIQPWP